MMLLEELAGELADETSGHAMIVVPTMLSALQNHASMSGTSRMRRSMESRQTSKTRRSIDNRDHFLPDSLSS